MGEGAHFRCGKVEPEHFPFYATIDAAHPTSCAFSTADKSAQSA
jgi:hypothetical protein